MHKGENSDKEKLKQLESWYSEQLQRKDKEIERLKQENQLLLKSAIKQAETKLPPKSDKEKQLFGMPYKKVKFRK